MNFIGPFYDYFIDKHGYKNFEKIKDMILSKIKDIKEPVKNYISIEDFYKVYVIFVFEVAVTDYWGFNDEQTLKYLKITMSKKEISKLSINRAKSIQKDAIDEIQKYLRQSTDEVLN